jgi:hypothetical protein
MKVMIRLMKTNTGALVINVVIKNPTLKDDELNHL